MSHPDIYVILQEHMQKQGVDDEVQKAFAELWEATDSSSVLTHTNIPCPQCFIDGVTGQRGIKVTGVPEGYPPTKNGNELEYFKCAFCKTRYWKLAE